MEDQKRTRIDWHKLFCGAFILDMHRDRNVLRIEQETEIGREPPRTDLIVIRKEPEAVLSNEIGRIFRTYNIIEYKAPSDSLDIKAFLKGIGYVNLYIGSDTSEVDAMPQDVTLTFVRAVKPAKLMKQLEVDFGFTIREAFPGIYHIEGHAFYPIQLVVTREVSEELHGWLKLIDGTEPDDRLYRKIVYRSEDESVEEREYIKDITRFVYERFRASFERFYKEEQRMGKTIEDFANEMAEIHIKRLEEEVDQYRQEADRYKQDYDQSQQSLEQSLQEIARLRAQVEELMAAGQ